MQARLLAFLLWAAVAASVVFWALRLGARAPAVPAQAVAVSTSAGARGDLTRLLGPGPQVSAPEAPQPAPDANRFQLVGVVAPRGHAGADEGLALIAVDGRPVRTYRVGAPLDERWVLQSVRTRGATLGPRGGGSEIQLELPPLPVANTGMLPGAATGDGPAAAAPPQPGAARPGMPGSMMSPRGVPPGMPPQPGLQQGMPAPQEMPPQEAEPPAPPEIPPGQGG